MSRSAAITCCPTCAALSTQLPRVVVFFGGTALSRTHLPDGRLSEDLDLYAVPRRADVVADVERVLADGVRREYGRLVWEPPLSSVRDVDPAVLRTADGLTVRVQLLDPTHYPAWPTEQRMLEQRYGRRAAGEPCGADPAGVRRDEDRRLA